MTKRTWHKKLHQPNCLSLDQKIQSQIDHIVIDARHVSSDHDKWTIWWPTTLLQRTKIRTRLCAAKNVLQQTQDGPKSTIRNHNKHPNDFLPDLYLVLWKYSPLTRYLSVVCSTHKQRNPTVCATNSEIKRTVWKSKAHSRETEWGFRPGQHLLTTYSAYAKFRKHPWTYFLNKTSNIVIQINVLVIYLKVIFGSN